VQAISERLHRFVAAQLARHAGPLAAMGAAAGDLFTPPRVRALLAALVDGGGFVARDGVDAQLAALSADERPQLRKIGLTIGSLDLFHPALLKPEAVRWRAALLAAQQGGHVPALPPHGAVWQKYGLPAALAIAGFRRCGDGWLRIDMAERLARQAHAARLQADAKPAAPIAGGDEHDEDHGGHETAATATPPAGFAIDPALATSLGLDDAARRGLLQAFGFRSVGDPELDRWRWSGHRGRDKKPRRKPARKQGQRPQSAQPVAVAGKNRSFAAPGTPHKNKRHKGGKPGTPPPRQDRPDRTARRGPSPHSPFAGLAALLADARKD
jgi:ATP-dependent RNA helicase SUPV3L1/SUV3